METLKEHNFFRNVYHSAKHFDEMVSNKGKISNFKRYVDEGATSKKWSVPLSDHAYESSRADEGYFISFNDGNTWYEVLDTQAREYTEMYYLYPVDEFGNKLTKSQIKKTFGERLGESYLDNIAKRGYALWHEFDPEQPHEWLVAKTTPIDQYRNGRIDYDNNTVRALDTAEYPESFDEIDEWGRKTPIDEYLAENPDFDPDIDSVPVGKVKRTKLPTSGNAEVRSNYKKYKTDYAARKAAAEEKNAERDKKYGDLYSPWGGYREHKLWELMPDVKDEDKEKLLYNIEVFGDMPYGHKEPDFANKKEFKKWVNEIGGDWNAVMAAIGQSRGAMSTAIYNSRYN